MKNALKISNRDMRTKTRKLYFEIQISIFLKCQVKTILQHSLFFYGNFPARM